MEFCRNPGHLSLCNGARKDINLIHVIPCVVLNVDESKKLTSLSCGFFLWILHTRLQTYLRTFSNT